ncbi:MAG: DUF58 domain-containing protein [Deltaproteobacteria bacterium]
MVGKNKLFPGESLTLHVRAENARFLPVWLQMSMHVEGALDPSSGEMNFTSGCGLLWYQQADFNWGLVARRRGVYRVGSARMEVGDLFGFFPREKKIAGNIDVIVYPRLVPLKPLSLPSRDFFGLPGAKSPVQDPIYILGTRDYQHGRPARHIHWKASARQNRLPLAVNSYERGYALGLVTNGVVEGGPSAQPMGRSPQKLSAILEILARLKMRANGSLADTMSRALKLPWDVSGVHFSYEHDEGTRATAQYFSHRRIPIIFVVCSSIAPSEGDGHPFGDKMIGLDEIRIEEAQRP